MNNLLTEHSMLSTYAFQGNTTNWSIELKELIFREIFFYCTYFVIECTIQNLTIYFSSILSEVWNNSGFEKRPAKWIVTWSKLIKLFCLIFSKELLKNKIIFRLSIHCSTLFLVSSNSTVVSIQIYVFLLIIKIS